jgi:hypothetical protein
MASEQHTEIPLHWTSIRKWDWQRKDESPSNFHHSYYVLLKMVQQFRNNWTFSNGSSLTIQVLLITWYKFLTIPHKFCNDILLNNTRLETEEVTEKWESCKDSVQRYDTTDTMLCHAISIHSYQNVHKVPIMNTTDFHGFILNEI